MLAPLAQLVGGDGGGGGASSGAGNGTGVDGAEKEGEGEVSCETEVTDFGDVSKAALNHKPAEEALSATEGEGDKGSPDPGASN